MGGGTSELSANGFRSIAPPGQKGFGAFDAMGGVSTNVSEETLWLTGLGDGDASTVTCADPTTGAIRGEESAELNGLIASNGAVYGFTPLGDGARLVAVAPPAACFG
jgi:hypothetical protein